MADERMSTFPYGIWLCGWKVGMQRVLSSRGQVRVDNAGYADEDHILLAVNTALPRLHDDVMHLQIWGEAWTVPNVGHQ